MTFVAYGAQEAHVVIVWYKEKNMMKDVCVYMYISIHQNILTWISLYLFTVYIYIFGTDMYRWSLHDTASKESSIEAKFSKMEGRWGEKCSCFVVEITRCLLAMKVFQQKWTQQEAESVGIESQIPNRTSTDDFSQNVARCWKMTLCILVVFQRWTTVLEICICSAPTHKV